MAGDAGLSTQSIAIMGLTAYSILMFVSLYQYFFHRKLQTDGTAGRYTHMKTRFFAIMVFSAFFDIPTYIGCIAENSPEECEWDNAWYVAVWVMHLIATCGYSLALTIPPLLWDDIINRREGRFLFEEYPRNSSRLVFMVCVVLYWVVVLYSIICILVFFNISDHTAYYHDRGGLSAISQLAALMEPVVIFTLSMTCLYYGVKLQVHVLSTGVSTSVQRRLLVQLNIVLCLIVLCYLARAVMLLRLFGPTPQSYKDAIDPGYLCWLLGTRWLCHIVCSLFLVRVMSKNSAHIAPGGGGGSAFNTPLKIKEAGRVENKDVFLRHALDGYGDGGDGGLDDSENDLHSVLSVLQEDYRQSGTSASTSSGGASSVSGHRFGEEPLLYSYSQSNQSQSQSHGRSQGTSSGQSSSFSLYVNQLLSTWSFRPSGGLGDRGDDEYQERLLARQQQRQTHGHGHGKGPGRLGGVRPAGSEQSFVPSDTRDADGGGGGHYTRRQHSDGDSSVEVGSSPTRYSYLSQVSSIVPPGTSPGVSDSMDGSSSSSIRQSQGESGNVFDPRKYQSDRYISVDSTVSN